MSQLRRVKKDWLLPVLGGLIGLMVGGVVAFQAYWLSRYEVAAAGEGDYPLTRIARIQWERGQYSAALGTLEEVEELYQLMPALSGFFVPSHANDGRLITPPSFVTVLTEESTFTDELGTTRTFTRERVNTPLSVDDVLKPYFEKLSSRLTISDEDTKDHKSYDYTNAANAMVTLSELYRSVLADEKSADELIATAKDYAIKAGQLEAAEIALEEDAAADTELSQWFVLLGCPLFVTLLGVFVGALVNPSVERVGEVIRDAIAKGPLPESSAQQSDTQSKGE